MLSCTRAWVKAQQEQQFQTAALQAPDSPEAAKQQRCVDHEQAAKVLRKVVLFVGKKQQSPNSSSSNSSVSGGSQPVTRCRELPAGMLCWWCLWTVSWALLSRHQACKQQLLGGSCAGKVWCAGAPLTWSMVLSVCRKRCTVRVKCFMGLRPCMSRMMVWGQQHSSSRGLKNQ